MPIQRGLPPKEADNSRYIHEYLRASAIQEERGMLGMGAPKEYAGNYPSQKIQAHLNKRASQGLRLAFMEPHWYFGREYISVAMSITRPLAIVGWYLTFERVD